MRLAATQAQPHPRAAVAASDDEDADMDEGSLLEDDLDDVDEDDLDQYRMLMSALRDGEIPDEDLLLDADVASDDSDAE